MLESTLRKYSDSTFVFVEPGGNHGDYLIYWGAKFLADKIGLSYKSMPTHDFLQYRPSLNEAVYIHGGGGFNTWCSGLVLECLRYALDSQAKVVIQGPCTIDSDDSYVTDSMVPVFEKYTDKTKYFFAREKVTYQIAEKFLKPFCNEVYLENDTALFLNRDEVINAVGAVNDRYVLYAFRGDNESGAFYGPTGQTGVLLDPALYCGSFAHWARVHIGAKKIITNRTHSSILGAILGKETILFPGRYHKNRSVWEYSLKQREVKWCEGEKNPDQNYKSDYIDYLPQRLRRSYKMERLVRFFQGVPFQ